MNDKSWRIAFLVMFFVADLAYGATEVQLRGRVLNRDLREAAAGIKGVQVTVYTQVDGVEQAHCDDATDDDGVFELSCTPQASQWRLEIAHIGYIPRPIRRRLTISTEKPQVDLLLNDGKLNRRVPLTVRGQVIAIDFGTFYLRLPDTASPIAGVVATGLAALAGAFGLRLRRLRAKRSSRSSAL